MTLRPADKLELADALRAANRPGGKVVSVDLSALNRVIQHAPEDMTAKVEAGITLAALQEQLRRRGQWLPIDPPHPERLTMAALVSANASGPRRFGFGTIRDHVIGLQVALADGRLASSGGNVVKNVAGYDLMKLFIGAGDSLGIPVEITVKLLPVPEAESFVQTVCATLAEAEQLTGEVLASELAPVVLDWHRAGRACPEQAERAGSASGELRVVLGFAGDAEQVRWQQSRAAELGFHQSATLDYEQQFWAEHAGATGRLSVLPSRLGITVRELVPGPFVARAGNGLVHYPACPEPVEGARPTSPPPRLTPLDALCRRVKDGFDPNHLLPNLPA